MFVDSVADYDSVLGVSGMVAKLKIDNQISAAIWECYHNMSGVAAALTIWVLTHGVLLEKVTVFGMVTSVEHPDC